MTQQLVLVYLLCSLLAYVGVFASAPHRLRATGSEPTTTTPTNSTTPLPQTEANTVSSSQWLIMCAVAAAPVTMLIVLAYKCRGYLALTIKQRANSPTRQPISTTSVGTPPSTCTDRHDLQSRPRLSSSLDISTPTASTPAGASFMKYLEDNESPQHSRSFSFTTLPLDLNEPDDDDDPAASHRISMQSTGGDLSDRGKGGRWGRGIYLVL
ncbi:hypothetical protein AeMF1_012184 [Aphanomyces euteiches]|nr:hypothetical protein AeMF1_012184 [Aphanomyces euteiches]